MSQWTHGAVKYPLPTNTGNSLLRDADPAVFFLLDYLSWCITHYLGARLVAEAQDADLPWLTQAVGGQSSLDPAPYLKEDQQRFPLVALYRTETEFTDRTIVRRQDASVLTFAYVLRPLTASQAERVVPILHAVKGLLDRKSQTGIDPEYAPPGGIAGDPVYSPDFAGMTDVACTKASFGAYGGMGDLVFPAITMTIVAIESAQVDLSSLPDFTGATASIGLRDQNGETPVAAVSKSDLPLTITAASPTSGPRAGGATVTLTTQNAQAGVKVFFGDVPATFVSMTDNGLSVVVKTPPLPAHLPNNFPASITVTGLDGQADRLPAAYTYVA